jgi:hypothetical protein
VLPRHRILTAMRILDIAAGRIPSDSTDIGALRSHTLLNEPHLKAEERASGSIGRERQRLCRKVEGNENE